MASVEQICDAARSLDAVRGITPIPDWKARQDEFVKKTDEQDDAKTTVALKRRVIGRFVRWLVQNGSRPTTQLVKRYLTERGVKDPLMKSSYDYMSHMICRFVNNWAETHNWIKKIPPLGLKKEKDAYAMPAAVIDKVSAHVDHRILLFGEKAEKLTTKEEAMQLAKDLGKYSP